jgi:4-amino-4-deoxy-L-arabinose transferase-like glycosyltransferase
MRSISSPGLALALAVAVLLAIHLALAVSSLVRENPTIDEVIHLPAGITYWQHGTFKLYRHNPPLVKLLAALPVIVAGVEMEPLYQSPSWREEPPNKAVFGHLFAYLNAADYFELFTRARLVMPVFSIVGGLVVFAWSRRLYGGLGGLLSLALWAFCPNVLAHARLVTTDVAATALGALATYAFWIYLKAPGWRQAAVAGALLGLAQLTKFSLILLFGIWPLLWLVRQWNLRQQPGGRRRLGIGAAHGALVLVVCTLVIDVGYLFEGVGRPLGRYEFISAALTRPVRAGDGPRPQVKEPLLNNLLQARINRFRGTLLGALPVALPAHYLLGFDDQKMEAEGIPANLLPGAGPGAGNAVQGYPVYLDGVLSGKSWWYYYLFAMAYKVPEGTWAIFALTLAVTAASRRSRAPWFDELALVSVPFIVLVVISLFTNINLGIRYVLPIFPYLFIMAGKLAPWAIGIGKRLPRGLAMGLVGLCLTATAAATLAISPHYLAYFNALSGGPARGSEHLIDSNLDWGQDLVGLRRWLARHAPGERVGLAYFGQINPSIFALRDDAGFDWFLPPALPGKIDRRAPKRPLEPGLYAVSASLLRGLDWRVYDRARWLPWSAYSYAFSYFRSFEPVAQVGHSILVYRLDEADVARLARLWEPGGGRPD